MIHVKGLDHVVIRARDAENLIRFYCDVLGCRIERRASPELGLTQLRAGASQIDILNADGKLSRKKGALPGAEGHNMDHFCVQVDPFDEAEIFKHLTQHGVSFGEVETRFGAEGLGPSLYFDDPEGNTVELKGPPSPGQKNT